MVAFYKKILEVAPSVEMDEYAEFESNGAKLRIFDLKMHNKIVPNSLTAESNGNVIIEFAVDNVDKEYERICKEDVEIVKKPETQAWGVRYFYFKDCDGNLIDFHKRLENQIV